MQTLLTCYQQPDAETLRTVIEGEKLAQKLTWGRTRPPTNARSSPDISPDPNGCWGADKAREQNAAIAAAPDSLRSYSALANWYTTEKKWPQAFATLERYVQLHPADPWAPYGIGRIAAASGQQLERGEQGIRAFLANPPRIAGAA